MKKLIIIGGGTGALEVKGIVDDINRESLLYEIVGILDDDPRIQGELIGGLKVLGPLSDAGSHFGVKFIFAIGSIRTQKKRLEIMSNLNLRADDFETIIHPSALINSTAKIGRGCIIHPRVTIGNDVKINDFVVIAVASTIGPYAFIDNYAMITSHVLVLSDVKIGQSVFIGSMTCIVEGVAVGSDSRVGVGSVVGRDVKDNMFVMGNPARQLGTNGGA